MTVGFQGEPQSKETKSGTHLERRRDRDMGGMVGMREKPSRTMGGTGSFIKVQTGQAERCLSGKPPRSLPPLPPWSCVNLLHLPSRVKYSKLSTYSPAYLAWLRITRLHQRQSVSQSVILPSNPFCHQSATVISHSVARPVIHVSKGVF